LTDAALSKSSAQCEQHVLKVSGRQFSKRSTKVRLLWAGGPMFSDQIAHTWNEIS